MPGRQGGSTGSIEFGRAGVLASGGCHVCTRLHAIGFPCEIDRTTAETLAQISTKLGKRLVCAAGEYRVWRGANGAEIWLHFPKPPATPTTKAPAKKASPAASAGHAPAATGPGAAIDDLAGLTVFHRGASDIKVRLVRRMAISKQNPLDGVCLGYLDDLAGGGRPAPFVFEQVGFAAAPLVAPVEARVQILGIAQKVWAYPTETAYLAATPPKRLIGRGALTMVEPDEVAEAGLVYKTKPATLWLVTGEIRRSIRMVNPLTGASYAWVLLATDRGLIDLIANPAVIEGDISAGHTLQTVASMCGRIIATN